MQFTKPLAGGGFFKPKDRVGHLILITKVYESRTRYDDLKKADNLEMRVDVVDLDETDELDEGVWVTHPGLVNKLKVGMTNVLGRIGTVDTGKGNAAFVLEDFTDADVPRAQAWVDAHASSAFTKPESAAAPAAPATATPAAAAPALDPAALQAAMAALQAQGAVAN